MCVFQINYFLNIDYIMRVINRTEEHEPTKLGVITPIYTQETICFTLAPDIGVIEHLSIFEQRQRLVLAMDYVFGEWGQKFNLSNLDMVFELTRRGTVHAHGRFNAGSQFTGYDYFYKAIQKTVHHLIGRKGINHQVCCLLKDEFDADGWTQYMAKCQKNTNLLRHSSHPHLPRDNHA